MAEKQIGQAVVQSPDRKEERGPKTPGVSLGTAVQLLRQVKDGVGFGKAARENVVKAMGYGSLNGRSNRALAALIHFGLLDRAGDAAVEISPLGKQVLLPRDAEETARALADAAMRPALYKKLFARFQGTGLPSLLSNILVREFGVLPTTSEEVAKIFRETVTDAALLRNGVLHTSVEDGSAGEDTSPALEKADGVSDEEEAGSVDDGRPLQPQRRRRDATSDESVRHTIPLDPASERVAMIEIPRPLAKSDMARIRAWANYIGSLDELDGPQ